MKIKVKSAHDLEAAITPERVKVGQTLLAAMAWVEVVKPVVRKYQMEILNRYQFKAVRDDNSIITTPEHTYLMSDDDFAVYLAELESAKVKSGFNSPEGYCPLLTAENNVIKARWALMDAFAPVIGIQCDDIHTMKHRDEYINILLQLICKKL